MARTGRPKSEDCKKKILSIRVGDDLYVRFCAYAKNHNSTITDVVVKALEKLFSDAD